MAHAIFYTHQTGGVCAGVCACNPTHQMEKTDMNVAVEEVLFRLRDFMKNRKYVELSA